MTKGASEAGILLDLVVQLAKTLGKAGVIMYKLVNILSNLWVEEGSCQCIFLGRT